jgi:hypothetical protein
MESIKQTAVEWLVEQIKKDPNLRLRGFDIDGIAEQAKEMEKEQKAENWQLGYDACEFHNDYDELQKEPIKNPYRNKK